LPDQWKESIIVTVHKKGDKTDYNNYSGDITDITFVQYFVEHLLEIVSVVFDVIDQQLIRYSAFVRYWRKKWGYNETVHQLFIDFKKAYY
jgi:hypothetical protein